VQPAKEAIYDDENPFIYFHDAHDAIACFIHYLQDQWVYRFNGMSSTIASLNAGVALDVIARLRRKPQEQLAMLADVQAFAAGVMMVINKAQE
jgi:hypothetical protein